MDNQLWWLNPVTGNVTAAIDEPPTRVGTINDDVTDFMRLQFITGIAACGYATTLITDNASTGGLLFRMPVTPTPSGRIRNVQVPSSTRNVQVPSSTRNVQYVP